MGRWPVKFLNFQNVLDETFDQYKFTNEKENECRIDYECAVGSRRKGCEFSCGDESLRLSMKRIRIPINIGLSDALIYLI